MIDKLKENIINFFYKYLAHIFLFVIGLPVILFFNGSVKNVIFTFIDNNRKYFEFLSLYLLTFNSLLLLYIMHIIRSKLFSSDSSLNVKTLNRHPKKENTRNGYVLIFESPLLIFCENLKKDDQLELHFDSRFEVVTTNEINLPYESNRENNKLVIKIKETKQSILITIPRIRIDEVDYEKSNKEVEVILLRGKKQIDQKKVTLFS